MLSRFGHSSSGPLFSAQAGWDLIGGGGDDGRDILPGVAASHWTHRWEKTMERVNSMLFLHRGPYLVGDRPTAADAVLAPLLARFDLVARELKGYDMRAAVPRLGRHPKRNSAHLQDALCPVWARTACKG